LNAAVDDLFYEKHEYLVLSSNQKNNLHLKHVKHGHVPNTEGGGNNGGNRGGGEGSPAASIKYLIQTLVAITTKFDKFNIPDDDDDDDDDDESSDEEEAPPNCSNSALTHQNKKEKQKK
jgi:hypothetical protein